MFVLLGKFRKGGVCSGKEEAPEYHLIRLRKTQYIVFNKQLNVNILRSAARSSSCLKAPKASIPGRYPLLTTKMRQIAQKNGKNGTNIGQIEQINGRVSLISAMYAFGGVL